MDEETAARDTARPLGPPVCDALERDRLLAQVRRALFDVEVHATVGRFRLERRLGAGGMGVVYSAHDPELERRVAIKVLTSATDAGRARLVREAQALARLSHPNVVTVFEVGRDAGRVFIAMELVDGERLDAWIAREPRTWREVLAVLLDAGRGIAAAHEQGLVHRDVKPGNTLVDRTGRARIVDFGLVRGDEDAMMPASASPPAWPFDMTATGALLGTPAYASPEQLAGEAADARSDQFAFAATAWEALTGAAPFGVGTERLDAIRSAEPARGDREVPAALLAPLRRALSADPAARHATMNDLLAAMAGVAAPARSRSMRRFAIPSIAAVLAIAAIGAAARSIGDAPAPARQSALLAADRSALACPIFEATGVDAPAEWLGAAAASFACRRAAWILGGRAERVLFPADLLGLPRQPSEQIEADPWARPGARAATADAARARAAAFVEGRVAKEGDDLVVSVRVQPGAGEWSTARSRWLVIAVRDAMIGLEERGDVPVAKRVDADVARWTGVESPIAGALLSEAGALNEASSDPSLPCRVLEPHARALGRAWRAVQVECAEQDEAIAITDVALDESSPEALASTTMLHFGHPARRNEPPADVRARARRVADRLREIRATATTRAARVALTSAEARALQAAGESEQAAALLLDLASVAPEMWSLYSALEEVTPGRFRTHARVHAEVAWTPDSAVAWQNAALLDSGGCPDPFVACEVAPERLAFQQRAALLAADAAVQAIYLGLRLLERGRVVEARSLGGRLTARGEGYQSAADLVLGLADAKEGWLGRGLARMRRAVERLEDIKASTGDVSLLIQTARLAEALGQRAEFGEAVARRFVLADPPRVPPRGFADVPILSACMHAPRDVARACIDRLRALRARDGRWEDAAPALADFILGAERFATNDKAGAARAWRTIATTGYFSVMLPVEPFDEAGEIEIAAQMDAPRLQDRRDYAGVHPAFARAALRAEKTDPDRARRLATRVIEAWSVADVPVPAVAPMRALLARLK